MWGMKTEREAIGQDEREVSVHGKGKRDGKERGVSREGREKQKNGGK